MKSCHPANRPLPFLPLALLALILLGWRTTPAFAQGTAFTYDGQLQAKGGPAHGIYNFTFSLYTTSSGGASVAGPVVVNGVFVTNGLFTVTMDFGSSVWNGTINWLDIGVETNGSSPFATLTPRQQLTPGPYAIFATTAGNLSGLLPASQLSGPVANAQLANNSITIAPGPGLSGGGPVPLGGATILNNAGVISLTGGGGVTVSAASGDLTLGSTATSADTANAIVSRDGTGSFSANRLTLAGTLNLPAVPFTVNAGFLSLLQADGNNNLFLGLQAGNETTTGPGNLGIGFSALRNNAGGGNIAIGNGALENNTGSDNVAVGDGALAANLGGLQNTATGLNALTANTSGDDNTAAGAEALVANTTGHDNTATGAGTLLANLAGYQNTATGSGALGNNTGGFLNTANGANALLFNTGGVDNTANGAESLFRNTSGFNNTASGYQALAGNTFGINNTADGVAALPNPGGTNNIALGFMAGANFTGIESSNIDIGHPGVLGDNNTIRIGNHQTAAYIAGVITGNGGGLTGLNIAATQLLDSANGNLFVGPAGNPTTTGHDNTGTGDQALVANSSGSNNVASGFAALGSNTTGSANTAAGYQALYDNTIGYNNVAVGFMALVSNTVGAFNTASGLQALSSNTNGLANTASGAQALYHNTSGSYNAAHGFEALFGNTAGNYNTANGVDALFSNTTGTQNTASGEAALLSNTTGGFNTAAGGSALHGNTTGNYNTASGYEALENNTIASDNTANGYQALFENTFGTDNTANGYQALYNNTSYDNTASGSQALYANTSGDDNTAIGYQALYNNTTGYGNAACGCQALLGNTTGYCNTASGISALWDNTTGWVNTADGCGALGSNSNGIGNTAGGYSALNYNTSGNYNTAYGYGALYHNTTGTNNVALGLSAGIYNTTGSLNIDIGNQGVAGDNNLIRIGDTQTAAYLAGDLYCGGGYRCRQGITGPGYGNNFNFWWTGSQLQAWVDTTEVGVVSLTSDRRLKENISPMNDGALDRVMALKPSTFKYKKIPGTIFQGDGHTQEQGFIADELQAIIPSAVNGQKDALTSAGTIQPQTINLMPIVATLTKAMQEQQSEINDLKALVKTLSEKK